MDAIKDLLVHEGAFPHKVALKRLHLVVLRVESFLDLHLLPFELSEKSYQFGDIFHCGGFIQTQGNSIFFYSSDVYIIFQKVIEKLLTAFLSLFQGDSIEKVTVLRGREKQVVTKSGKVLGEDLS